MKKLCVVNYVYGEKYQDFIPLYIISLGESYPEYDVRIYIDKKLTDKTSVALEKISKYYNNYTIIEDYALTSKLTDKAKSVQQIQRCQRWLFYDEAFSNYEAIYIGDIDLLLCKEEKPLFEQHCLHCKTMGVPYSNISRAGNKKSFAPKMLARNLIKFGPVQSLKYYFGNKVSETKFSGLHFIKTDEYFEKVCPLIDAAYCELNKLACGKSKKYNLCSFNNEAFLRDIVLEAGFADVPLSTGEPYNIETDAEKVAYRPHHGIHLGIFRSSLLIEAEKKIIGSAMYRDYYRQFQELEKTAAYKEICGDFSEHLNTQLQEMRKFYSSL